MSDTAANKALVVKAITELLIDGDASAIDRFWGDPAGQYTNHNPQTPNGTDGMRGVPGCGRPADVPGRHGRRSG
jgi:predicted SnoaL-like aldol condensation-catalyzing enzyme